MNFNYEYVVHYRTAAPFHTWGRYFKYYFLITSVPFMLQKLNYIKNAILPAVLCTCETWSLALREGQRLKDFINIWVLRTQERGSNKIWKIT